MDAMKVSPVEGIKQALQQDREKLTQQLDLLERDLKVFEHLSEEELRVIIQTSNIDTLRQALDVAERYRPFLANLQIAERVAPVVPEQAPVPSPAKPEEASITQTPKSVETSTAKSKTSKAKSKTPKSVEPVETPKAKSPAKPQSAAKVAAAPSVKEKQVKAGSSKTASSKAVESKTPPSKTQSATHPSKEKQVKRPAQSPKAEEPSAKAVVAPDAIAASRMALEQAAPVPPPPTDYKGIDLSGISSPAKIIEEIDTFSEGLKPKYDNPIAATYTLLKRNKGKRLTTNEILQEIYRPNRQPTSSRFARSLLSAFADKYWKRSPCGHYFLYSYDESLAAPEL